MDLEHAIACPFVGTYVRSINKPEPSRRHKHVCSVKIQFPKELRIILGLRGSPQDRVLLTPKGEETDTPRPEWLESLLAEESDTLHLELTDRVTDSFDRYRFIEIHNHQISLPPDLKRKVGIKDSFEYVIEDGRVLLETKLTTAPTVELLRHGNISARNTPLSRYKPGTILYVRPCVPRYGAARAHVFGHPTAKQAYIEITTRPKFPTSAYHKTFVHSDGIIRINEDMWSELRFTGFADIKMTHTGAHLFPSPPKDRYRVTAKNNRVSLPKDVRAAFFGRPDSLYLYVAGTQPPKESLGRYFDIREDLPEHRQPDAHRLHLGTTHCIILPKHILPDARNYTDAVFIARGNHVEMRLF